LIKIKPVDVWGDRRLMQVNEFPSGSPKESARMKEGSLP
jgi:hypothetical protein